jgi:hypothetical protein
VWPGFLDRVQTEARRLEAPRGVLASLAFLQGLQDRDWPSLVRPSEVLAGEIAAGRRWINPSVVLDAGVMARLREGDPDGAQAFFLRLEPLSGRSILDFRSRLLRAHLDRAISAR